MKSAVVIIDPLSSGALLKRIAKSEGHEVVAVYTMPMEVTLPSYRTTLADLYADCDAVIESSSSTDVLQQLLDGPYAIKGVFAGMESGVEMADELADTLHLPSNPINLSNARRDKAEMREVIKAGGLACPDFQKCFHWADAKAFAETHFFPLVVKTPKGAGTNNVFVCESIEELSQRFYEILSSLNFFGQSTPFVLIEEYIGGLEYIVDLFSDGEKIHLTDVWVYEKGKPGGAKNLCWSCSMIDPKQVPEIVKYAIKSAKVLGIERGASHAEIKDDPRKGPVLIEIGARLCGAGLPNLMRDSTNFDIYRGIVQVFTDGNTVVPDEISMQNRFAIAFGVAFEDGEVAGIEGIEEIQKLPSYIKHTLNLNVGDAFQKSVDMKTTPLFAYLGNSDAEQLARDVDAVHRLFKVHIKKNS